MAKVYKTSGGTRIKTGSSGGKQFSKTTPIKGGNRTVSYNYRPPKKIK